MRRESSREPELLTLEAVAKKSGRPLAAVKRRVRLGQLMVIEFEGKRMVAASEALRALSGRWGKE